jgi:hypothetical protein
VTGRALAVVEDAEAYQRLLDIAAHVDVMEAIRHGLDDAASGRSRPAARRWFNALERVVYSLERLPHLLYGKKPNRYRIIYEIDEPHRIVRVLTPSSHVHPPVHIQHMPGDVPRLLARQKPDRRRDVFRLS